MRSEFARYSSSIIAAIALAACSPDRATAPNVRSIEPGGPSADLAGLASAPTLYNQTSSLGQSLGSSVEGQTIYLADDFVVPTGFIWTLTEIGVSGSLNTEALAFSIRKDANGIPGDKVSGADFSLAPSKTESTGFGQNLLFSLGTSIKLPAGKYWLVPVTSVGDGSFLFTWQQRGDVSNHAGLSSTISPTFWQDRGLDFTFGLFGAAQKTQTIKLSVATQDPAPVASTATVSATATSALTVALAAGPASVCNLAGGTLSFVATGTCTVTANQAGDATYAAAPQVTKDIVVTTLAQTIAFPPITPNPATISSTASLGAVASSGLAVSYSSLTPTVCTVGSSTVNYIAAGLCTVAADQAGNATYEAAPRATQNVDVQKIKQTIAFTSAAPAPGYINGTYTVSATGGASGNAVTITVGQPGVCTVSGSTVRFVGVGSCIVTANQAGNAMYDAAAAVTQSVKVDYRYEGFLDPIKNGDVLNTAKAGQTIALKWRLTDANGAPITSLAMPRITVDDLNCSLGTTTDQPVEQAAGNSGLQNLANGYYQFNWKSPSSYAKSCKVLQLDLGEGTGARTARFAFTK